MNWLVVGAGAWVLVAPLAALLFTRSIRLAEQHGHPRPLPNIVMDLACEAVPDSASPAPRIPVARPEMPDDCAPVRPSDPAGAGRVQLR